MRNIVAPMCSWILLKNLTYLSIAFWGLFSNGHLWPQPCLGPEPRAAIEPNSEGTRAHRTHKPLSKTDLLHTDSAAAPPCREPRISLAVEPGMEWGGNKEEKNERRAREDKKKIRK